jgi:hypothetical protein
MKVLRPSLQLYRTFNYCAMNVQLYYQILKYKTMRTRILLCLLSIICVSAYGKNLPEQEIIQLSNGLYQVTNSNGLIGLKYRNGKTLIENEIRKSQSCLTEIIR